MISTRKGRPASMLKIAAVVCLGALMVSCAASDTGDTDNGDTPASNKYGIPEDIANRGTIIVGLDPSTPPYEFLTKDGQLEGLDVDLVTALLEQLGLEPDIQRMDFGGMIPALQANRVEMVVGPLTITDERLAVMNMVPIMLRSGQMYMGRDDIPEITKDEDLCGHRIAAFKGTDASIKAEAIAADCGPGTEALLYKDQNTVNTAIAADRADIAVVPLPIAAFMSSQPGSKLATLGVSQAPTGQHTGYGFALGGGMAEAMQKALDDLIASGKYEEILKKWGVDTLAVD